ncbi:MAG: hypothetical protein H7141_14770 [Burkholderiales bacterium]|nr:hypothetical protein [Bacteroidia bacterium]
MLHTPRAIQPSGNVVDDDGKTFRDLFKVTRSWNKPQPFPTKVAIDKSLKHVRNIDLASVYKNYRRGK